MWRYAAFSGREQVRPLEKIGNFAFLCGGEDKSGEPGRGARFGLGKMGKSPKLVLVRTFPIDVITRSASRRAE